MSSRITYELVLNAYCAGAFPMGGPRGEISWYSPDPRCIIPLDAFHVPKTLAKTVRRGVFEIRINSAFPEVLAACGKRSEGTWITPRIARLYGDLFEAGYAQSMEAWKDGNLVGGLYGVTIGAAFFGESMFHRATDASKVALVALIERLRARDYRLLDTQWQTAHLMRFGAAEISREEYVRRLQAAIVLPRSFVDGAPVTFASGEP
jgi:leucyl/phenylalanyl-tRNA--protein transferase